MDIPMKPLNPSQPSDSLPRRNGAHYADQVLAHARAGTDTVLKELGSQPSWLTEAEAASRLKMVGRNEIVREQRQSALMRLPGNVKNPLVLLLLAR